MEGSAPTITPTQMLAFLVEHDAILPKRAAKLEKYLADTDHEEHEDAVEEVAFSYEAVQRKTKATKKITTLTPEQLEEKRAGLRTAYIASLPTIKKDDVKNLPYGLEYKDITKKAQLIGFHIIIAELEKLSTTRATTEVVRADGSKGANHQYYKHPESAYKRNADNTPFTIKVEGAKSGVENSVVLATTDKKTKGWTFAEVADNDEFMSVESVCKDTNDDELRQVYLKPMLFQTDPEWKGDGFCDCEVKNKKFNMFLKQYDPATEVWKCVPTTTFGGSVPTLCCNAKVSTDGKCKRHNNPSLKEAPTRWTSCGGWMDGDTMVPWACQMV
jgi:hypothetical protein